MSDSSKVLYCPALRMKAGELGGVRELWPEVADFILPRFIVPPFSERDDLQGEMFDLTAIPDVGMQLAKHWIGRNVLIDVTYLLRESEAETVDSWLPQLFARARSLRVNAIPMAMLGDLNDDVLVAFKGAIQKSAYLKFALGILSSDFVDNNLNQKVSSTLRQLELSANECAVIADFSDADFSEPDFVTPVIRGVLESLQEAGDWKHVVFQGTHFPEKNPAEPGSHKLWPRNEWKAWKDAVQFDPSTAEQMIFGDFAADCAKIAFGGGGGAPAIVHYRYTIKDAWLIERAAKTGAHKELMQGVCKKIVESGYFSGAGFSNADAYIQRVADSLDGPGNSTMWRQINTTHHITRVVTDVAKVREIAIAAREVAQQSTQFSLIE